MSNYINIGCVTRDQSQIVDYTDGVKAVFLMPNTVYRVVSDKDCLMDISASGFPQDDPTNWGSGIYLPGDTVEYLATTSDKTNLFVTRVESSGTLFVSRVLGAKI